MSSIKILITSGEPAGIGPELVAMLALRHRERPFAARLVVIGDAGLLRVRAHAIGASASYVDFTESSATVAGGTVEIWPHPLAKPVVPGVLDPANAPSEAMWQWVVSPEKAPDKPEELEIGFESGTPVSVNGSKLPPVDLLNKLNEIAATNGIGRTDLVENRLVGMKSRGAYETPGGTLLVKAHQELERLTVDRETAHFQQALSNRYAELVYYGLWFSPLREALDGFFQVAQQRVTGAVGLKLWKGTLSVTKRVSPFSLYRAELASFTMGRYNPKDAEGFINLFALPVTVRPRAKAETK